MSDPCFTCPHPDCRDDCEQHLTRQQRYHRRLKAENSIKRTAWQIGNATKRRIDRLARELGRAA